MVKIGNIQLGDFPLLLAPGEHEAFGDQFMEENGKKLPWGRMGTPNDIGRAATFLASSDADYITGTTLVVDGGLCLRDARE